MQLSENPAAILPWVVRGNIVALKSDRNFAADWMIKNRAPAAAARIVKAAVPASSTLDPDWAIGIRAFIESASTASAFFRLYTDRAFQTVPLRQRNMITTVPGTAVMVDEGVAKPLSPIEWATVVLEPVVKAVAVTAFSNELWLAISADGQQYMHRQLVKAVSKAVDSVFLDLLTDTGTPSAASSGTTAGDAWKDLRAAILSVNTSGAAKIYLLTAPDVASRAATLDAAGMPVFPAMSPTGGELCNAPALVSSGAPAGSLYAINADAILAASESIIPRETTQADLLMRSDPSMSSATPAAAQMTNMWQADSTGIIAEAVFAVRALRDDAVHVTTGINWGG